MPGRDVKARAKARFKQEFAEGWADRIEQNPPIKDQLMQLCLVAEELDELQEEINRLKRIGEDTQFIKLDNGLVAQHPCRVLLKSLRAEERAIIKALGAENVRRNTEVTKSTRFSKLLKDGKAKPK